MTKNTLFTFLLLIAGAWYATAQIHAGTKRLFWPENASPLINVYDIEKGTLLKSINREELGYSRSCFSANQSKFYVVGKMYAHVIDANTLEAKKITLLTDTAVFDFAKWSKLNDAESKRVLDEIEGGNLEAKYEASPEMKAMKLLPTSIVSIGVTEKGQAVLARLIANKAEYLVYDLNNNGNKVATFTLSKSGTLHGENLLHPEADGSISVVDILTGNTIKKIDNAYNDAALTEARNLAKGYTDKYVQTTLISYCSKYFTTNLTLGMTTDKTAFQYAFAIYDAVEGKVIYNERGTTINKFALPVMGSSPHSLLQKTAAKTPEPVMQMPPVPDYAKLKPAEMATALEGWRKKLGEAQAAYKVKHDEWSMPQNFVTKVFADVALTQELLSVDGARYAGVSGEYLYFQKEGAVEIYDITTKKLIQTIYLI